MTGEHYENTQDQHPNLHWTGQASGEMDRRLSRLEAVVESLAANVGRVTQDVGSLSSFVQQRGQTNWGTIFAGITLVVLLVTGYVGLPLHALEETVQTIRTDEIKKSDGHEAQHVHLAARIRDNESTLNVYQERFLNIEREVYTKGNYMEDRPIRPEECTK